MRTNHVLLLLLTLSFLISCNSNNFEEHQIGDNLIDETSEVVLIDTLTIKSSTVILDSLVTSRFKKAILGSCKDEFLGDVKTEYYGVLDYSDGFSKPTKEVDNVTVKVPIEFDSLVFMAYPNREYFGDTLQVQRLLINRLTEDIELPDNEYSFYSHSKFDYAETPLLDSQFFLMPVKQSQYDDVIDSHGKVNEGTNGVIDYYGKYYGDGIYIKMNSEEAVSLGKKIVELVNTESDTVTQVKQWQKFIKGIVIRPGDNNTVMWQAPIDENKLRLRLYYHETDYSDAGKQKYHDFPIVSTDNEQKRLSFTNYSSDRSTTPQQLDRLIEQENELNSYQTDNLTFIQGGIGLYTKINIPYIENLKTLGLTGGILSAELQIYPKDDSYDDELFPLPKNNLILYNTKEDNKFRSVLPGPNNAPLSFAFVRNPQNKDESYYLADLTSYVNNVLVNGDDYDDAILIGFQREAVGDTYDRLIIEDEPNSDFRIKLKVTYVIQR
ncbi:DUF4270 family protein [Marinifilum fragile]|uniref:DUF4270 family protein n=1 Tax=Marinifilum fragile TaxID=570161 RepID=UPI002AA91431|nr:DUF4270 family protein [Marinifilum fragile]